MSTANKNKSQVKIQIWIQPSHQDLKRIQELPQLSLETMISTISKQGSTMKKKILTISKCLINTKIRNKSWLHKELVIRIFALKIKSNITNILKIRWNKKSINSNSKKFKRSIKRTKKMFRVSRFSQILKHLNKVIEIVWNHGKHNKKENHQWPLIL